MGAGDAVRECSPEKARLRDGERPSRSAAVEPELAARLWSCVGGAGDLERERKNFLLEAKTETGIEADRRCPSREWMDGCESLRWEHLEEPEVVCSRAGWAGTVWLLISVEEVM